MLAVWWYRKSQTPILVTIEGSTMGTTYHVSYFDEQKRDFKTSIDSLLILVNKSINNYDTTSEVSRFNKSKTGISFQLPYLLPVLQTAKSVFEQSVGAFDVTVLPLVNAWGFGPKKGVLPDSTVIDSLRAFVGFEKISLSAEGVYKKDTRVQLDFGGIGQGYGADVVAAYLQTKGIDNMLVELGGEGIAYGKNLSAKKAWEIGILDPNSTREKQFFKAYASLSNKAFTTSGNYFNYREVNGKKYGHTISPTSGYPVQTTLLSATVFADKATTADAWATAFMVMGYEQAIQTLQQHPELDALLLYADNEGKVQSFVTKTIETAITINP
jgi:FAD:protein FMN transferase